MNKLKRTQDILFVDRNGNSFIGTRDYATKLFSVLSLKNNGSVATSLFAQKCLIRMINQGFNALLIQEITGHAESTYKKICALINADMEHIQTKLQSFICASNQRHTRIPKKGHFRCRACGEMIEATSEKAVLLKYPNDDTLYLYCKECGEKEKARFGGMPNE